MDSKQMELFQQKTLELRSDELLAAFNVLKEDGENVVEEHQDAYVEALLKTRLIAPVEINDIENEQNKMNVRFCYIKDNNDQRFIVLFSDADAARENSKGRDIKHFIGVSFSELASVLDSPNDRKTSGFVINPFTDNIVTGRTQIERVKKYIVRKKVKEGSISLISEIYDIPEEATKRLESYFNKRGDIKKAYIFNMKTGEKINRLIIVDIFEQSDFNAFVREMNEDILVDITYDKIPFVIMPFYDENAKKATIEKVPFYVKV